jgi:predicted membrane channel-forming protein YqfA (hemolysin III family)
MTEPAHKQSIWEVIKSIACAILGVQSQAKMQQDFTKGSIVAYVIGGLIAIVLIITIIASLVTMITSGHS